MLWCGVRVGVWLAGCGGVRLGVGCSLGPCCGGLCVPLRLVGRVGVRGVAFSGGPVPWSRVLRGFRPLALDAAAVPSSSSGACGVALVVARGRRLAVRTWGWAARRCSQRLPLWV